MTDADEWQGRVGDAWAREFVRTDRTLAPVNEALIRRAGGLVPDAGRILDVGCGAGATSLALAAYFPAATIHGIDLSGNLVAAANARPARPERVSFAVADASRWHDPAFRPDLLVSRHGVMFFDDPVAAFANLRASASQGASLVFSCFRARTANGWATDIGRILPPAPPADPHAPGPFAFADADRVGDILHAAGWQSAEAEALDFDFIVGEGDDSVAEACAYFATIGPAASVLAAMNGPDRSRTQAAIKDVCTAHADGQHVTFPAAAWIWSARA